MTLGILKKKLSGFAKPVSSWHFCQKYVEFVLIQPIKKMFNGFKENLFFISDKFKRMIPN